MPWSQRGTLTTPVPLPPDFDEETAREDLYDSGERTVFDKFPDVMTGEDIRNAACQKLIAIRTMADDWVKPGGNVITVRKRSDGATVIHVWSLVRGACSKTIEQPPAAAMMPRWKCHKEVFAVKIVDILPHDGATDASFAATLVGDDGKHYYCTSEYMGKHKPQEGGYLVEYDDGYRSWSPCKAFEEGYTRIS